MNCVAVVFVFAMQFGFPSMLLVRNHIPNVCIIFKNIIIIFFITIRLPTFLLLHIHLILRMIALILTLVFILMRATLLTR